MEELRRRIDGRGTEGAEEKERRLQAARQEIAQIRNYDYLVVNDEVQQAVLRIEAILLAEQGRISRYSEQELKVLLGDKHERTSFSRVAAANSEQVPPSGGSI